MVEYSEKQIIKKQKVNSLIHPNVSQNGRSYISINPLNRKSVDNIFYIDVFNKPLFQ